MFRQNKQNRKDARKLFAFLQPTAAISLKFSLKTRAKCAQERRKSANLNPSYKNRFRVLSFWRQKRALPAICVAG
ncbi:hypothetical protein CAMRE0001_1459 [Campylobacter rectus RM3267]|uniref:Uncharacterized protein n=1 Tax=Campylobacter rectus RM3267 TaxID=553218 RepID=B9D325_CAMRE|nr:hypothetical protein CAMRE0001_1459 [Campylobacter rectus RM3267]